MGILSKILESFTNMLMFATLAVFIENTIFSRAIGSSTMLFLIRKKYNIFIYGIVLTSIITIASVAVKFLDPVLLQMTDGQHYRPLIYMLIIMAIYIVSLLVINAIQKTAFKKTLLKLVHLGTFNCVVLGALLLPSEFSATRLSDYLGFAIGSGFGFTLSTYIVMVVSRELDNGSVPKSFKGMPIILLYVGILSMVIYGFLGRELPF